MTDIKLQYKGRKYNPGDPALPDPGELSHYSHKIPVLDVNWDDSSCYMRLTIRGDCQVLVRLKGKGLGRVKTLVDDPISESRARSDEFLEQFAPEVQTAITDWLDTWMQFARDCRAVERYRVKHSERLISEVSMEDAEREVLS